MMGLEEEDDLTMARREQHQWRPDTGPTGWLCTLVNTFELTEQLSDVPCDERLLSEMRARLAQPALPTDRRLQFQPQH